MSTRSIIAIKESHQTSSICCRFDGYPMDKPIPPTGVIHESAVGGKLNKYYTSVGDVIELIALGNLEQLGKSLEECKREEDSGFCHITYSSDMQYHARGGAEFMYVFDGRKEEWSFAKVTYNCDEDRLIVGEFQSLSVYIKDNSM